MHNLCVKLAALTERYFPLSPQVFLDRTPMQAVAMFKATLPEPVLQVVDFAFNDQALRLILENELVLPPGKKQLEMLRPHLTASSWLWVNGVSALPPFSKLLEADVQTIVEGLWHQTAKSAGKMAEAQDRVEIRRELDALVRLHLNRVQGPYDMVFKRLTHADGRRQFFHLAVVEAMYKADAARVLFGPRSAYTLCWEEKQQSFLSYAKLMRQQYTRNIA